MTGNNDEDMLVLLQANEDLGREVVELRQKLQAAETERDAALFQMRENAAVIDRAPRVGGIQCVSCGNWCTC
jgi:hypothetical protein